MFCCMSQIQQNKELKETDSMTCETLRNSTITFLQNYTIESHPHITTDPFILFDSDSENEISLKSYPIN